MRSLQDIDRDIADARATLRALHEEKREAIRSRTKAVVSAFDDGLSPKAIAEKVGIEWQAARHMLWRAGRTVKGRTAIRQRLRAIRPGVDQVSA